MATVLGQRLGEAKRSSGLTWEQVASRSGYSSQFLQAVTSGRRNNMSIMAAECVAETLGVKPVWLVGWES